MFSIKKQKWRQAFKNSLHSSALQLWLPPYCHIFADTVDTLNTSLMSQLFIQAVHPLKAQNRDSLKMLDSLFIGLWDDGQIEKVF